ncbi:MAG: mechanosensitive ion channel family protein [Bacillota bacterium]
MLETSVINELINESIIWIENNLFSVENLIDIILLLFLYFVGVFIYRKSLKKVDKLLQKLDFISLNQRKRLIKDILKNLYYIIVLWTYILLAEITGLSYFFSRIVGNLLTAWIFIKIITTFLPDKLYVKLFSFLIWTMTALNILNIYDKTINILDGLAFKSGNLRISLLLVIKALVLFAVFFIAASKINEFASKRIEKSKNLTPSIKVLMKKISKFVFFLVAVLFTLSSLGISLSAFAFLGGTIGVGLGFGLQKIVSNFISGIIILLDKSIKPGDVVEVNNIYGRVKNLDTRFVSVVTLSGKEYLVPNENFITNQVINWSYSDERVRIDVPVGVAYDSDMNLVKKLLLKSLEGKDRIVNDPAPSCILKEFGDSTVNFELRFWIRDPQNGLAGVRSDVLFSVWNLLKENGISIAFPQQDVHFQSMSNDMYEKLKKAFNSQNINCNEDEIKEKRDEAAASKEEKNKEV